jgi:RNA polymerase sigma factor (sigma-70 family)
MTRWPPATAAPQHRWKSRSADGILSRRVVEVPAYSRRAVGRVLRRMTAPPDRDGDEQIVRWMKGGEARGLEALLRVHAPHVLGVLRRRFDRRVATDTIVDAVHDAAHHMFRHSNGLDAAKNLGGYFYVAARREVLRTLPDAWHEPFRDGVEHKTPAPSGEPAPPNELSNGIAAVIDKLPERERDVLALDVAHSFQLSSAEIANLLGTTPHTVDALRSRTKKRLEQFRRPARGGER